MERDIKIDSGILKSCVTTEQFIEMMGLHKALVGEYEDVKAIKNRYQKNRGFGAG